jgi:hypothetical protein
MLIKLQSFSRDERHQVVCFIHALYVERFITLLGYFVLAHLIAVLYLLYR